MKRLTRIGAVAIALGTVFAVHGAAPQPNDAKVENLPLEVAQVLESMDKAGESIETLTAEFDYELNQTLFEDIQKRKGEIDFKRPNRLRLAFVDRPKEAFIFDGRTLYHVKPPAKQIEIWALRREGEPPVESFELGKTPFPMPFGQKKEKVVKHFHVGRDRKAEAKDKKGRAVLVLRPRKGTAVARDYEKIALWIDPKTHLPTRVRMWDPSENITTIDFRDIKTGADIDDDHFDRPKVPQGWDLIEHEKASPESGGEGKGAAKQP